MDTKHPHEHDGEAGDLHHEVTDISVRPIAWFGVSLAVLVLISMILMKGLFVFFERQEKSQDSKPTGVMAGRPQEPPQPRLQTNPVPAMKEILAKEKALLDSYGWLNEKTGSVRIPVQRAMELLAERGLPVRVANEVSKPDKGSLSDSMMKTGISQAPKNTTKH